MDSSLRWLLNETAAAVHTLQMYIHLSCTYTPTVHRSQLYIHLSCLHAVQPYVHPHPPSCCTYTYSVLRPLLSVLNGWWRDRTSFLRLRLHTGLPPSSVCVFFFFVAVLVPTKPKLRWRKKFLQITPPIVTRKWPSSHRWPPRSERGLTRFSSFWVASDYFLHKSDTYQNSRVSWTPNSTALMKIQLAIVT